MSQTLTQKLPTEIVIPENKYEAVIYLQNLKTQLEQVNSQIDTIIESTVNEIADTQDDTYICEPVFDKRKTSVLDYARFETELPQQYKDSLTIRASDAEKLIGKDKLKQLVIDSVGYDAFEQYADVTLTEARKHIPKAVVGEYITEHYKKVGYQVRKK